MSHGRADGWFGWVGWPLLLPSPPTGGWLETSRTTQSPQWNIGPKVWIFWTLSFCLFCRCLSFLSLSQCPHFSLFKLASSLLPDSLLWKHLASSPQFCSLYLMMIVWFLCLLDGICLPSWSLLGWILFNKGSSLSCHLFCSPHWSPAKCEAASDEYFDMHFAPYFRSIVGKQLFVSSKTPQDYAGMRNMSTCCCTCLQESDSKLSTYFWNLRWNDSAALIDQQLSNSVKTISRKTISLSWLLMFTFTVCQPLDKDLLVVF